MCSNLENLDCTNAKIVKYNTDADNFLAHLSRRLIGELIQGSSNKEWDFLHSLKICVCI